MEFVCKDRTFLLGGEGAVWHQEPMVIFKLLKNTTNILG